MAKNTGPALTKHDTSQSGSLCLHGDLWAGSGRQLRISCPWVQRRMPRRDIEGVHGDLAATHTQISFAVAGHCHYATAIHGHTGGVYRSKRKSSGSSLPPFHQYRFCQRRYSRNR